MDPYNIHIYFYEIVLEVYKQTKQCNLTSAKNVNQTKRIKRIKC